MREAWTQQQGLEGAPPGKEVPCGVGEGEMNLSCVDHWRLEVAGTSVSLPSFIQGRRFDFQEKFSKLLSYSLSDYGGGGGWEEWSGQTQT